MKRILSVLLALSMVLTMAACGSKQEETTTAPAVVSTEAPTEVATTPAPTTPAPTPTVSPTTPAPTTPAAPPTTAAPGNHPGGKG